MRTAWDSSTSDTKILWTLPSKFTPREFIKHILENKR